MRIVVAIVAVALLGGCSANKKTKQARINAAYDARTEAQRNAAPRSVQPAGSVDRSAQTDAGRSEEKATVTAGAKAGTNVMTGPTGSTKAASEWAVTSIKGKFLAIDTTLTRVYMDLTARNPAGAPTTSPGDFISHFQIAYVMYPDYNNRERLAYGTVPLTTQNVAQDGDHLTLVFDVKRPKDAATAVLLTEITEVNTGTKARNDLPIRFRGTKLSDRFTLFDRAGRQAQLRNFINAGDTVMIGDVNGTHKPLFGFRYRHEFDAASSPMNTTSRPAPRSLAVDSTLQIETGRPFTLPREGLYYFMEDTTDANGIGLVVTDKRFPKLTRPEKLIKPVLYMSTSTEINELNQAQDTKKAFDRYWLSLMSGNEEVARRTLKAYFDRVEEANRLFTSYKEGWKTDKGMIYIVLGPPDRVQRNREREVWVYNRRANVSEINFTFTKKPNQFVEDHYELVRFIEYQPVWYPIVEAWRTGAIRE